MNKLVFDLGMHNAQDSEYYLKRGFDVIAVEANSSLCADGAERLAEFGNRLTILNRAFADTDDKTIEFFISKTNLEWSSTEEWRVLASSPEAEKVSVQSVNLPSLIEKYGVPHYIKCDLEGADAEYCKQLIFLEERPDFTSVEITSPDWFASLRAAGYERFQLVNQAKVRRYDQNIDLNSRYGTMNYSFGGHSSGPFGYDLPNEKWITFAEVFDRWHQFTKLRAADPDMTLDNWFDLHATTLDVLNQST